MSNDSLKLFNNEKEVVYFYERLPLQDFQKFAVSAGLKDNPDLHLIQNHIDGAKKILEVGGGFGRVVEHILKSPGKRKIDVLEAACSKAITLEEKFMSKPNVVVHNADVRDWKSNEQYDLILWMWSGISDLDCDAQQEVIKKLFSKLAPNGVLVIDTTVVNAETNATFSDGKNHVIDTPYGSFDFYVPSVEEMTFRALLNDASYTTIPYKADERRSRILHLFSKK